MNIYVSNLSFDETDDDLLEAFESHGQVESANIIMDNYTGRSKGFGFVEMPEDSESQEAISELEGQEFLGRTLRVNEARPRPQRGGSNKSGYNRRNDDNSWQTLLSNSRAGPRHRLEIWLCIFFQRFRHPNPRAAEGLVQVA